MRDYYEILGLSKQASDDEIKKVYRKLAMKYHPDRNTDNAQNAEEKFKEIKKAYEVLSNSQKRAEYDQFGHDGAKYSTNGGGFGGFEDIFGDILGGGRRAREQNQRGSDLAFNLQLTLEESAFGVEKEIRIPKKVSCQTCGGTGAKKGSSVNTCVQCGGQGQVMMQQGFIAMQQTCPACHGSGKKITDPCYQCHATGLSEDVKTLSVKIPAGVDTGDRIRLRGEGEAGRNNSPSGDLFVQVSVKAHEIFERDGQDLHCDVPVSFLTSALGGEVNVPTLSGHLKLKIPNETQSHKVFRLRGKGLSSARHGGMGSLYCRVVIETPVKLSSNQKSMLKKFDKTLSDKHRPKSLSWTDKVKSFIKKL